MASTHEAQRQSSAGVSLEPVQQQPVMAVDNVGVGDAQNDRPPATGTETSYRDRARTFAQAGELSQAVWHYRQAIALTPKNSQLHYELGEIEYRRQDLAAARNCYERAIALQPTWGMAFYQLALVLTRQGCPTDAIGCYRKALARFEANQPHCLYAYNNIGLLFVRLKRFDEALEAYRAARAIDPNFVPTYNNLGKLWFLQGEFDRAIATYHRALELNPEGALTHYNLGKAYQKSDRHSEAVTCFQKAIELEPDRVSAEIDCGVSQMARGEYQKAFADFHRIIARQPEWVKAYCDRAAELVAEDNFERARWAAGQLVATIDQQPDSPDAVRYLKETYTYLGNVQFDSDRYNPAAEYFRQAAAIDPEDDRLKQQLQKCASQQQRLQALETGADRFPRGVYPTTRDWWMRSDLDSTHYVRVNRGAPSTASPEPQPPSFAAEDPCAGLACHRCLKSTFETWEMTDVGGGVFQCARNAYGVEPPETFVATIPQGRTWVMPQTSWWQMCETMATVTPDNYLLADVSPEYPGQLPSCDRRNIRQHRIFRMEELPPCEQIEGTVAVVTALSANVYFHWMVDVLPRLDVLRRGGFDFDRIDKFFVNQYRQPFQKESLQRLGIPEDKIIESDRHPHIRAERLLVPSLPSHFSWLSSESVRFLRQTFLPKIEGDIPSPERIYISRTKTRYRHLLNEPEVLDLLQEYGFVSVCLETLSLDEQVHLFSRAKAIVAPHGSGLTNILFCQPQTSVIEIVSPNYFRHYFGAISQLVGLRHYYLRGEVFACSPLRKLMYPNPLTEDIKINLETLRKTLERIGIVKPIQLVPLEAFVVNPMPATVSPEQTAATLAKQAETLLARKQIDEAISACKKAIEIAPQFAPAYKIFGNVWHAQKQSQKARECYLKAIEIDPNYGPAYANLGSLAAQEKNWPEAIGWYQKAISRDPSLAGAYDRLSKVWKEVGRDAESIDCAYRAYELEPTSFKPEEHLNLGDRLFDRGQLTQAMTCYRQALELAPRMQSVYERLSRTLTAQGKSEEAAIYARHAVQLSLEAPTGNPSNGNRPVLEKQPEKIAASRQQAAEALLFQGKLDDATQACEEALHIDPNFVPTLKTLGNIAHSRGDIEKAREYYLKAIEIDPDYAEAHANLGNLAAQAKQWSEAAEYYQKAIALKPDLAAVYERLSKVWQQLGKEREAAECAFRASKLNPSSVGVARYLTLGNTLFRYKYLDEAVFCFRQALELNPKLFAASQNLAEALTQQGKSDEAARYYRQAMQLYMSQSKEKVDARSTLIIDSPAPSAEHQAQVKAALEEAKTHYERQEWQLAVDACKRALDIQPEAAEAYATLGNACYAQGNYEEAQQAYTRAIALKPDLAYVRANLGSICAQLNQPEEAIAHYQAAVEIRPKFPLVYRNWGQLYQNLEKWEDAADCYRQAIEIEPKFVPTYQKLAEALIAAEDWQGAGNIYQQAIELESDAVWAYCGLGDALTEQAKWEDAAQAYKQAIELEPEFPGLSEKLGDLFQKRLAYYSVQALESYRQAVRANPDRIDLYHKILEITPNDVHVHLQLVRALERQGQLDEAIVFAQRALRIEPDAVEAHIGLGKVLAKHGQLADATTCYGRAIELAPNASFAHHHLGEALSLEGQSEQAIASFGRALEMDSEFYQKIQVGIEDAKVYFDLAKMFERQNELERAIACYHRATQLNPNQCWYFHHLADALVNKDYKSERAIEFYRRAIAINPTPSFWHYQNLGVVLFNREEFAQAKECFQKAIEIDSSFSWSHKKLGDIWVSENNIYEASICYRKAVRLQPKISI